MKTISSYQVADILGINISTLKRWTDSGKITCEKTAGGHRRFTLKNIRDYYNSNGKLSSDLGSGFSKDSSDNILKLIENRNFKRLATHVANYSLKSDYQTIYTIISGLYMINVPIEELLDYVIEPASIKIEDFLKDRKISHPEAYMARNLITRSTNTLLINPDRDNSFDKSALCVNFENNIPDLGVVMAEVLLSNQGYNVYNTGSHAKLGNLKNLILKNNINMMLFYLCDQQCCNAVISEHISKTEEQIKELIVFSKTLGVKIYFGGEGLKLLPKVQSEIEFKFLNFHELKAIL